MPKQSQTEELRIIKEEVVELEESPLYEYRKEHGYLPVIGEGDHGADIMFIGEAPGESEAKTGRPFCGRSGKLLDEFLKHIDLDRGDVYITNVLKDRPPNNRDPQTQEIEIYTPFLRRQISIIQPQVIATLGRFSMEFIAGEYGVDLDGTISQVRGQVYTITEGDREVTFIPLFHPAVALYDGSKRDVLKEDFAVLQDYAN